MALRLAEAGARLWSLLAPPSRGARCPAPSTKRGRDRDAGGRALAVACNVREEESIRELINTTLDEFGAVDVLVNNAGIGGYAPFLQMTLREWD